MNISRTVKILALGGLMSLGLLVGELPQAEAKPPSHAKAWGYRARQSGASTFRRNWGVGRSNRVRPRYYRTRYRTSPYSWRRDVDRDGIRNRRDRDVDGDGIRNRRDRDKDGDGVRNRRDRYDRNPRRR